MSSIARELISGDIHEYKASTLRNIAKAFHMVGYDQRSSVFLAGIGNSHTDGVAYSAAGIPLNSIFIINPAYEIQHWSPKPPQQRRKRLIRKVAALGGRNKNADTLSDQCKDKYHYLSYEDPMFINRIKDSLASKDLTHQNTADNLVDVCEASFDLIDLDSS